MTTPNNVFGPESEFINKSVNAYIYIYIFIKLDTVSHIRGCAHIFYTSVYPTLFSFLFKILGSKIFFAC